MPRNTILQLLRLVNTSFSLSFFIIQRNHLGLPDEGVYIPLCNGCSQPITDPSLANIVSCPAEHEEPIAAGEIDGDPLLHVPGVVRVYHLQCDPGGRPWLRLSKVWKADQRAVKGFSLCAL